ncbi:MAG: MFS transporter [Methylophilaceae bacterium]|nr:MFS transporter [Methylophilaceae bacterium]
MASFLSKERIIASANYNRWLIPPAALAVHLCIGMAYGFSVFWKPLAKEVMVDGQAAPACAAGAITFAEKLEGTGRALFATDCNWTQFDLGWMYTLFFVLLGCSAALWGGWLERAGPRKAGVVATICWVGGLLLTAFGIHQHQLWMMWLGSGVIGGVGLGLGYISPVSTLIKWFPDKRGMATGLAIMGFGGGALVGSPIATKLMEHFSVAGGTGVWQTFVVLAAVYAVFMLSGSLGYRVPPSGWQPEGWQPPPPKETKGMIATRHVHLKMAHKTPQFWLLWLVLCMNVSASIGIIGAAAPMLQETFGGALFNQPEVDYSQIKADESMTMKAAEVAAAFVGLISLLNIFGRIAWASSSDKLGRKQTYFIFFTLGVLMYLLAAWAAHAKVMPLFLLAIFVIVSMYGGGFATIPAYLADMFGTQFVGAIHGRLLTAWSTAGILGPVIVNYMHDIRMEEKVPFGEIYHPIFYVLAGILLMGFIANLLVKPVADHYFMSDAELAAEKKLAHEKPLASAKSVSSDASQRGMMTYLAWLAVLIPIAYGVWSTLLKAKVLLG